MTPFAPLNAPVTPSGVAVDAAGRAFFIAGNCVYKLDASGSISLVAGTGIAGFSGDGGPASAAELDGPQGVAADGAGNVYIADTLNGRIRKVATNGTISTVAGNGGTGSTGDGGPALSAEIGQPGAVAIDATGNLYFNDVSPQKEGSYALIFNQNAYDYVIRKVSVSGTISTVAGIGGGACGDTGDGGPATSANLTKPYGLAVDSAGNLFIADVWGERVRKVASNGNITTIAGNDTCSGGVAKGGYSGDNGPASSAALWAPAGVGVDSAGDVYIADLGNNRVRKVTAGGSILTVAGTGVAGYAGDGGPATSAQINQPIEVAVDATGNLYIAESGRIRKVTPHGGLAASAYVGYPAALAADTAGNVYVADSSNNWIRKLKADGSIVTIAGTGKSGNSGDGGPAAGAQLNQPSGIAVDSAGNLYIADTGNSLVRRVAVNGTITTFAGNGSKGYSGDGGPASSAQLNQPSGVAVDSAGNVYIADTANHAIRLVTTNGKIATAAGTGSQGNSGDGGPAASASFNRPGAMTLDVAGNLYIVDSGNLRIRKLVRADGTMQAVPGGSSGLQGPLAIAVDPGGNLYIADVSPCVVLPCTNNLYRLAPDGTSSTVSYTSVSGFGWVPVSVAVDRSGNLFVGGQPYLGLYSGNPPGKNQYWGAQIFLWLMEPPGTNPLLSATITHASDFIPGQPAAYEVVVTNAKGAGTTHGTVALAELVPTGLTVVSMAGTGWSCNSSSCTRSDALTGGSSYPPITVSVSVASTAIPQIVNQVGVSGGGAFTTSAKDVTNVGPMPAAPAITSVMNAATFQTGGIAPNEFITINGSGLGPATGTSGAPATLLAGTRVHVGGALAMVTYAQDRQVNAIVPWGVSGTTTAIQVEYDGVNGTSTNVPVAGSSPGIFSQNYGPGQAWVANQNGTFNSAGNPASRGTYIVFWATGQGLVDIPQQDGARPNGPPFPKPLAPVSVSLGGVKVPDANVAFKGLVYTGEIQLNVLIPNNAPAGASVPLVLTIGSASSRGDVTVAIK